MLNASASPGGIDQSIPPVVEMRNITKRFGATLANDRVSLTLFRGEILGLLGENGAGKSTLMRVLYGLYRPDAGSIYLNGKPVHLSSARDAARLGIGMVHQEFMLIPPLTVAQNIVLGNEPGNALRLDLALAESRVAELSDRYGLRVDPRSTVADLSVGLRQRVEILKALYRDARVLVLDEPSSVLTPSEVKDLFAVLRQLVSQGLSIVFITHKLGELMNVSDRVTVLRDGREVGTLRTPETTEPELARLMVGREVILRVNRTPRPLGALLLQSEQVELREGSDRFFLRDINLTVRGGEILGIAGVDGNGQRELAEVLAGMRAPTSGRIFLDSEDVTTLGPKDRYKRGLAYIPEDRRNTGSVQGLTVMENLTLKREDTAPLSQRGWLNLKEMRSFAQAQVRRFDVRPARTNLDVASLSGGNQQKVILARELSGKPKVIIAAQPTRGLDVGATEFVHKLLLAERDRGAAIILISFELDEIRSVSDRITVLFGGQLVGSIQSELATDELLGLWMAGRKEFAES
jgi:general nucleoside transport system ATP-binding protein